MVGYESGRVVALLVIVAMAAAGCTNVTTDTSYGNEDNSPPVTGTKAPSSSSGGASTPSMEFRGDTFAYRDAIGYYHVVGEVQNAGSSSAQFVKITATFYREDGTVFDTGFTFTMRDIIAPGAMSPFDVMVEDDGAEIRTHKVTVSASATSKAPPGDGLLVIQGDSSRTDSIGYFHIVGEVQNQADRSATYVQVLASLYDASGQIVRTSFTFTDPSEIQAGEAAPFDVMEEDAGVASYKLWVDAQALR